jgi:hypothetical protein
MFPAYFSTTPVQASVFFRLGAALASLACVVASFSKHSAASLLESGCRENRLMYETQEGRVQVDVMKMTWMLLMMMMSILNLISLEGCDVRTHRRRCILEKH